MLTRVFVLAKSPRKGFCLRAAFFPSTPFNGVGIQNGVSMNNPHAAHMQRMIDAVLTTPGDTDPTVRHAVEERATEPGGPSDAKASEIPPELTSYVKKVALHAYRTTDEDIEALRNAGYSEDAIFEITLSTALGAGMARLERGLAALKEEK